MQRIASAIGYTPRYNEELEYWELMRSPAARTGPQAIEIPETYERPLTARQAQDLVMYWLRMHGQANEHIRSISHVASDIYSSYGFRLSRADQHILGRPGISNGEKKIRKAIRTLAREGIQLSVYGGDVIIPPMPIIRTPEETARLEAERERTHGREQSLTIINAARTEMKLGDNAPFTLPIGYRAKEGLNGAQYNSLTGFPDSVWHPDQGKLFYSPERRKVFEVIRRVSTTQPEGMGFALPEGLADVKDVATGMTGQGNYRNIRKSIPVEKIEAAPASREQIDIVQEAGE